MVEIAVRDFIANIRKNGLPQGFGDLFASTTKRTAHKLDSTFLKNGERIYLSDDPEDFNGIEYACAFGQGLINSGAIYKPSGNGDALLISLYATTWSLNDDYRLPIPEIADRLETDFERRLDDILTFEEFDYSPWIKEPVA